MANFLPVRWLMVMKKDKDNPHQLIPDPVAAPVVKKIFQYFIDGMTYAEIARKLNADGYLCPKAYKLDKAGKANEKSAAWTWSGEQSTKSLRINIMPVIVCIISLPMIPGLHRDRK